MLQSSGNQKQLIKFLFGHLSLELCHQLGNTVLRHSMKPIITNGMKNCFLLSESGVNILEYIKHKRFHNCLCILHVYSAEDAISSTIYLSQLCRKEILNPEFLISGNLPTFEPRHWIKQLLGLEYSQNLLRYAKTTSTSNQLPTLSWSRNRKSLLKWEDCPSVA